MLWPGDQTRCPTVPSPHWRGTYVTRRCAARVTRGRRRVRRLFPVVAQLARLLNARERMDGFGPPGDVWRGVAWRGVASALHHRRSVCVDTNRTTPAHRLVFSPPRPGTSYSATPPKRTPRTLPTELVPVRFAFESPRGKEAYERERTMPMRGRVVLTETRTHAPANGCAKCPPTPHPAPTHHASKSIKHQTSNRVIPHTPIGPIPAQTKPERGNGHPTKKPKMIESAKGN